MSNEMDTKGNLFDKEAVEKMKEIAEKCRTCMMVTDLLKLPSNASPMTVQVVEDNGSHFFISSSENEKNADILKDNRVQLYYQNNSTYQYLSVYSEAVIHTDKTTIEKYWSNFANAWFDGKDDPRVTIIEVKPTDAYYWDTKDGKIVSFVKMGLAAFANIKLDDGGVEGNLNV